MANAQATPAMATSTNTQPVKQSSPVSNEISDHYVASNHNGIDFNYTFNTDTGSLTIHSGSIGTDSYDAAFNARDMASIKPALGDAYASQVTHIQIDNGVSGNKVLLNTFKGFNNVQSIDLDGLNTSDDVLINTPFNNATFAPNLQSINLHGLNTQNVQDFSGLFKGLHAKLDGLNSLDTSSGVKFDQMFQDYSSETNDTEDTSEYLNSQIDKWNVSKGASFYQMFKDANLNYLDLSSWNMSGTSQTTDVTGTDVDVPYTTEYMMPAKMWKIKVGPKTNFVGDGTVHPLVDPQSETALPDTLPIKDGVVSKPSGNLSWISEGTGTLLEPNGIRLDSTTVPLAQWGISQDKISNGELKPVIYDKWNELYPQMQIALLNHDTATLQKLFAEVFGSSARDTALSTYKLMMQGYQGANQIYQNYYDAATKKVDASKLFNQTLTLVLMHTNEYTPALNVKDVTVAEGQKFDPAAGLISYDDELGQQLNYDQAKNAGLTVDTSALNPDVSGTYPVIYKIGNLEKTIQVSVTADNNHGGGGVVTPTTPSNNSSSSSSATNPSDNNSDNNTKPEVPKVEGYKSFKIYNKRAVYRYRNVNFKKNQRIKGYKKAPRYKAATFKVVGKTYSKAGNVRYKLSDGSYITANHKYVAPLYWRSLHAKIYSYSPRGIYEYKDTTFAAKNRVRYIKRGTLLKAKKFFKRSDGANRFELTNGHYITANKQFTSLTKPKNK